MALDKKEDNIELKPVARIYTGFTDKFGVPRQSGLAEIPGRIVFEPEFRDVNAVREIERFSHLWLIWGFSENKEEADRDVFRPTVRPPRLGGNTRVGVFASRSPFRPNGLGLSVVKLESVDVDSDEAPVLCVSGADMVSGTPVYDIKPYLPYADSVPDARGGFSLSQKEGTLNVDFPEDLLLKIPEKDRDVLIRILAQDPRPQYQNDPERIYKMDYNGIKVSFTVEEEKLYVKTVEKQV
ncbi:MAG: tRNA (N6-threonylcarbamoyladenosine(37)-N6)-methyltransferase TrmO [Lachnospiraceae bacterium]|nr:tRNA (N6-threonylcarbamoyladenosine(37)-N6)-methyltransferase TrmO [Lachnospiraceae bacterium]